MPFFKNVIPAEAGIQRYLDKSLLYFWFPVSVGTSLDSRLRGNDDKVIRDQIFNLEKIIIEKGSN